MCVVGVVVVSFGWNRYRDWWSVATILAVLAVISSSSSRHKRRSTYLSF